MDRRSTRRILRDDDQRFESKNRFCVRVNGAAGRMGDPRNEEGGKDPAKVDKGEERRKSARFGWEERLPDEDKHNSELSREAVGPLPLLTYFIRGKRGFVEGEKGVETVAVAHTRSSVRNLVIVERGTSNATREVRKLEKLRRKYALVGYSSIPPVPIWISPVPLFMERAML